MLNKLICVSAFTLFFTNNAFATLGGEVISSVLDSDSCLSNAEGIANDYSKIIGQDVLTVCLEGPTNGSGYIVLQRARHEREPIRIVMESVFTPFQIIAETVVFQRNYLVYSAPGAIETMVVNVPQKLFRQVSVDWDSHGSCVQGLKAFDAEALAKATGLNDKIISRTCYFDKENQQYKYAIYTLEEFNSPE